VFVERLPIKGGVVFDAQALLREVESDVQETTRKPATISDAGR